MLGDISTFATAHRVVPTVIRTSCHLVRPAITWHGQCTIVLLRASNVIGHIIGSHDMIQLSGDIILLCPSLPSIDGDIATAVVGVDHPLRIIRIDPEIMVVAMRHSDLIIKCLSAISGSI